LELMIQGPAAAALMAAAPLSTDRRLMVVGVRFFSDIVVLPIVMVVLIKLWRRTSGEGHPRQKRFLSRF
jgi:hypothetical protein